MVVVTIFCSFPIDESFPTIAEKFTTRNGVTTLLLEHRKSQS